MTQRPRPTSSPSDPADLRAADALRAAAGICSRCESASPALAAMEHGGVVVARCVNEVACKRRLRASLVREGTQ